MARAKMIDDAMFNWMENMRELEEMRPLARENPDLAERFHRDIHMCDDYMKNASRDGTEVIFSEATVAERPRMPTRGRPEFVLKWALQKVKSPILIQSA